MNFFEYTIEVNINETSEKITNNIQKLFISGQCPFNLHKMIDEETNECDDKDEKKKTRTIIITSIYNIHQIVFDLFKGTNANFRCYYKMHVVM